MSDAPTPAACVEVRRKDREVSDDAWIKDFLRRVPAGTLATVMNGQPFVNMNIFAYSEPDHAVYMHTAKHGRTRTNVDGEERVCFSVSEMGRLLPAKTALEMSVEYSGVVIFGRTEVVADPAEAERALDLLLARYFPHLEAGRDYRSIQAEELARTAVYRIRIDAWSGKRKQVAPDFPGAFHYGEWPDIRDTDERHRGYSHRRLSMDRGLIDQYVDRAAVLRKACAGLSEQDIKARPGPGKWSILEIVVHLADSDAIAIDRMKRMLIEDNPPLLYADETAYVDKLHTHDQTLDDALALIEINRRQFARVLRKLPDEAFRRTGNHNRRGEMTIGGMVADYVKHVDDHLKFLIAKRANLGKPLT